ncbi:MAG: CRISPR-associated protein [Cyanobacteriota bacterium]|nr:CRISPR-associated protein [Cyanobacteriota bacterium]
MNRLVISTIGTSLLTNQINRGNPDEKDWFPRLRDSANLTLEKTPPEAKAILESLKERALEKLKEGTVGKIRSASAELNGIYGIYEENLQAGKQDVHLLIATDTAQGEGTANIVGDFLKSHGIANVQIWKPKGLSTASTEVFTNGIDELLEQIDEVIPGYKESGYRIFFNLVGGFKSLQAYLNTIGMFYADEIIYIFEGPSSEMITIPRLPIAIDRSIIDPMKFALMAAGEIKVSELGDVPETTVVKADDVATLSNWGKLTWNNCKLDLLSQDLLPFPGLEYEKSFVRDYKDCRDKKERTRLQELLAKVSYLLTKNNGDTASLTGVKYDVYTNKNGIAHFRYDDGRRVSCIKEGQVLKLRHYGEHDYVNDNP